MMKKAMGKKNLKKIKIQKNQEITILLSLLYEEFTKMELK
jgi:hypothetical protein